VVTIGTFDGVHIGHRKIIRRVTDNAASEDCESLILTFFPHPRMVLQPGDSIKLLNTPDEKNFLLDQTGLDSLIIHPFDQNFSKLEAEDFVREVLVEKFKIHKIIIGHDHRFGRNRAADINDLVAFGQKYGFHVEQIPVEEINDISVSSTKIRNAIAEGNLAIANRFLDYNYILTGTVVAGKQLGRSIGFPTANIQINEAYKLLPKNGVYVVDAEIEGDAISGMMNIGTRPTVGGNEQSVEVHFFDFDSDLYDKAIRISVLHRLRDEQHFPSVAHLKEQLIKDKDASLAYITAS
jgi:riboflavin kinase/FMN adenylyltransferase